MNIVIMKKKKNIVNIVKFNDKNESKQITFIDNKDKNNVDNSISFAENVKKSNHLKSKRKSMNINNTHFLRKKNANKQLQKLYEATDRFIYEKLNFKEYLRFKCCYRNRRKDILIVQRFRRKLLSEEHFFKSHLFIYLLIQKIKIDKQDKSDIKELYSEL